MPTGSVPPSDAVVALPPALSSPAEPVSPSAVPVGPVLPSAGPVGPVSAVVGVLGVLWGAREVVTRASRVPLGDAGCDTLADVIAAAARLRSATDAVLLAATAALEAARPGSGRSALVERARVSKRDARRTVEVSEQVAQMPNVARGLAVGELNVEHAAVLADAARRTSPDAVDTAGELLEAAAAVSPETLRDQAKKFAARHDPAAVECELGRQRRERCGSLFVDESSGMGVLHASFDPVSFALVRQALENYNDALWRLDGGRDATPDQIRDNRQRLADSLFEIVTDRNALATIEHPAAHPPNTARRPQPHNRHDGRSDTDQDRNSDHGHDGRSDTGHGGRSDTGHGGRSDTGHGGRSDTGHGGRSDTGHDGHSDDDRGRNSDHGHGHGHGHGQSAHAHDHTERPRGGDAGLGSGADAAHGHNGEAEPHRGGDGEHDPGADADGCTESRRDGGGAHGHNGEAEPHRGGDGEHDPGADADGCTESRRDGGGAHGHNGEAEPHRGGGDSDAMPGREGDAASEGPAGRSVERWRPAQAPNQVVIIAEIGVIDGTKPDGTCELLGAGPVPPSILDSLSPDTRIAGALFDTNGEILWLGRSRRHASIAQQLAVAIRDRGCVLCRSPMHRCRNHHIDEWAADGGNTDVPNLAALCGDCHHKLHNNNERLERRPAPARWITTPRTHTTGQTNDATAKGPP